MNHEPFGAFHALSTLNPYGMNYYKAANLKDIRREGVIEVDLEDFNLLLYRDGDDSVHCLINCCSHDNSKLSNGTVKKNTIACPQHGAEFNLKTGEALSMPAVVGLEVFPVKVEGEEIFVGIED